MNKQDLLFLSATMLCFLPFFIFEPVYQSYLAANTAAPYWMAFLKFSILATYGEAIGMRIKTGKYSTPGFGLIPKAIVWGFLGMWIAIAMKTFAIGAPAMAETLGIPGVAAAMKGAICGEKILGALFISVMMNTTFGPVFMTIHKITDTHILDNGGKLLSLVKPMPFGKILASLNWNVQWNFVFKKTLPFFWVPAHTITFLLPVQFQVLFAAFLSIVLGIILSIAAIMSRK